MPPQLPPQEGVESIGTSTDNDTNACNSISTNFKVSRFEVTEESSLLLSQKHQNDLIRDLCLFSRRLSFFYQVKKTQFICEKDVKVSHCIKRNKDLSRAFVVEGSLCYCHNVEILYQTLGEVCVADGWRLFINSSKQS